MAVVSVSFGAVHEADLFTVPSVSGKGDRTRAMCACGWSVLCDTWHEARGVAASHNRLVDHHGFAGVLRVWLDTPHGSIALGSLNQMPRRRRMRSGGQVGRGHPDNERAPW